MTQLHRDLIVLSVIALTVAAGMAMGMSGPAYTDAFYYFNAGQRLANGQGLTDPYVALTYIGAPEAIPAPSHTYWMPLVSLVVALAGGSFRGAQIIFVGLWLLLVLLAFWLGLLLGKGRRHAWAAGLLTVFCGYYAAYMVTTDAFALFGITGALALLTTGWGRLKSDWRWYMLAGLFSALAHLARADGILFLGVLVIAACFPSRWLSLEENRVQFNTVRSSASSIAAGLLSYAVMMFPWFIRNIDVIGTPLPVGGASTIWLRGYNELVSYPPAMSSANFLEWGAGNILNSRWIALTNNLGTFVAVEGLIVLAPLIVLGVVKRWRNPLLLPVWLYAVLLHIAMTFIFAFPGYRGGLFHSSVALLPWWMVLGILGLDDAVEWAAKRRHTWRPFQAKGIFTAAVMVLAAALTLSVSVSRWGNPAQGALVAVANELLPDAAIVMSNDPAALYYHTGLGGIVVPEGGLDAVQVLVDQYHVTHVLLDENYTQPLQPLYEGAVRPDFLRLVEQDIAPAVRVFEVLP